MTYCLDSWPVLRWLEDVEPAASRVDAVLSERPLMSWINLGEVFYITARSVGIQEAHDVVRRLRGWLRLDLPTPERVLAAAAIKATHALAYADAFAVVTALAHGATLLTGDPEIVDGDASWPVEDLR